MTQEKTFGTGKLPPTFLASMLTRYGSHDPRVIVGPGIGLDATVLDLGEQYLVAKSDPITFATDQIGWYAVNVNANDVACMGATPHWFLATILLPPESPASLVESIFEQIHQACTTLGVTLVGGHTEISYGLARPLIAGTMLGTVAKNKLVTLAQAEAGDLIIVAKGFPIEGAAIIAHECASDLKKEGWTSEEIEEAQHFLWNPGISVVHAAQIATQSVPLHGMHDPTEGGLATGLREIAEAASPPSIPNSGRETRTLGLEIYADALPLLPTAARLCAQFNLDPLGTIASGALCLVIAPQHQEALLTAFQQAAIPAAVVGKLLPQGAGEWLLTEKGREPLPEFTVDEITKLF